jgi:hypothetical protein
MYLDKNQKIKKKKNEIVRLLMKIKFNFNHYYAYYLI